jgi:hypothetical protein
VPLSTVSTAANINAGPVLSLVLNSLPLVRQFVLVGHRMEDGVIASRNYVWLSQWFLDNFFHLYTRPLDLKFHHRLTYAIARALFPLLDSGWYAANGGPYCKRYTDLCAVLDIPVYKQLSRVQQQLDPSNEQLVHERFVASYDYPLDDEDGKWTGTVRWWPGPKWFYDQQSRSRRKQLIGGVGSQHTDSPLESSPDPRTRQQPTLPLQARRSDDTLAQYTNRVTDFYRRLGHTGQTQEKIAAGGRADWSTR